jgi:hypothetical protein
MALNKIERELLVAARELIESGEEFYICHAIQNATSRRRYYYMDAAKRLERYISKALAPHIALDSWQRANGYDAQRGVKQDRLAWIDWMLDQPEME